MSKRLTIRPQLGAFGPACQVKLYVGGGVSQGARPGRRIAVDPEHLVKRVQEIVALRFPGSTHFKARGFWKGTGEPTVVVDILQRLDEGYSCGSFAREAQCTAAAIARVLHQEAVVVLSRDTAGRGVADFVGKDFGPCKLPAGKTEERRALIRAMRR